MIIPNGAMVRVVVPKGFHYTSDPGEKFIGQIIYAEEGEDQKTFHVRRFLNGKAGDGASEGHLEQHIFPFVPPLSEDEQKEILGAAAWLSRMLEKRDEHLLAIRKVVEQRG